MDLTVSVGRCLAICLARLSYEGNACEHMGQAKDFSSNISTGGGKMNLFICAPCGGAEAGEIGSMRGDRHGTSSTVPI